MNKHLIQGLIQLVLAVVFLVASVYCMRWIVSSASLAPAGCHGDFSLFHTEIRCRQPYIALILCIVATMACVLLAVAGYKKIKGRNKLRGS